MPVVASVKTRWVVIDPTTALFADESSSRRTGKTPEGKAWHWAPEAARWMANAVPAGAVAVPVRTGIERSKTPSPSWGRLVTAIGAAVSVIGFPDEPAAETDWSNAETLERHG